MTARCGLLTRNVSIPSHVGMPMGADPAAMVMSLAMRLPQDGAHATKGQLLTGSKAPSDMPSMTTTSPPCGLASSCGPEDPSATVGAKMLVVLDSVLFIHVPLRRSASTDGVTEVYGMRVMA